MQRQSVGKGRIDQRVELNSFKILPNECQTNVRTQVERQIFDYEVGHVLLTLRVSDILNLSRRFIKINQHLFDVKSRIQDLVPIDEYKNEFIEQDTNGIWH